MTHSDVTNPLIAVVTICLDQRQALLATAQTVLSQSYRPTEYIVVDGGSTDGSAEAAATLKPRDSGQSLRVVSEADRGISDAMNKGTRLSRATLIVHLNAGDTFADDRVLEDVAASYTKYRWRWAVGDAVAVAADGSRFHRYSPIADPRLLLRQNTLPHQATFLERSVFDEFGPFRVDLHQAMDYEYWCRIGLLGGLNIFPLRRIVALYADGGRSSQLSALLPALWQIRRELRAAGAGNGRVSDWIFLARVALFGALLPLKRWLVSQSWWMPP